MRRRLLLRDVRGGSDFVQLLILTAVAFAIVVGGVRLLGGAIANKLDEQAQCVAALDGSACAGGAPVHRGDALASDGLAMAARVTQAVFRYDESTDTSRFIRPVYSSKRPDGVLGQHGAVDRRAFGDLMTPEELEQFIRDEMEWDARTQGEEFHHMHATRRRGMTAEETRQLSTRELQRLLEYARAHAQRGDRRGALAALVPAVHMVADSFSASHSFEEFCCKWWQYPGHILGGDLRSPPAAAVRELRRLYGYVFGAETPAPYVPPWMRGRAL